LGCGLDVVVEEVDLRSQHVGEACSADFMTRRVVTSTPDTTLLAAAKLMLEHRVGWTDKASRDRGPTLQLP
jgi:CBS domain-containing protein